MQNAVVLQSTATSQSAGTAASGKSEEKRPTACILKASSTALASRIHNCSRRSLVYRHVFPPSDAGTVLAVAFREETRKRPIRGQAILHVQT